MIKVRATTEVKDFFLPRYKIWCDHRSLYQQGLPNLIEYSEHGIPCYHYTEIDAINKETSDLVIIDCLTESIHSRTFFDRYHKEKHYVIISGGWWDQKKHDIAISYDLIYYPYFLNDLAHQYLSPGCLNFYIDKNYKFECEKNVGLVSIIGQTRKERNYLVDLLVDKFNSEEILLKYSGKDLGIDSDGDVVRFERSSEFDSFRMLSSEHYHTTSSTLPVDLYNQGNYNLVVETDIVYQHSFFLTEKTLKTLITGMPFVVYATPDFLINLKKLGFLTYDKFWDESYDQITDQHERANSIVSLCEKLQNFDWKSNLNNLRLVADHNAANFTKINKYSHQAFEIFENTMTRLQRKT